MALRQGISASVFEALTAVGLNLHAVFERDELPSDLRRTLAGISSLPRVLLLGNGGFSLWSHVEGARERGELPGPDPIDTYSIRIVRRWLSSTFPSARGQIVYPPASGEPMATVDLQALGVYAGWHHPTPFMVGINAAWGPWFAYRVLLLTDAPLDSTSPMNDASPCATCVERTCISACPADALTGRFDLARCAAYRTRGDSICALTCRARLACPVGREHRYPDAQLAHSYGESLRMLRKS